MGISAPSAVVLMVMAVPLVAVFTNGLVGSVYCHGARGVVVAVWIEAVALPLAFGFLD